jgi:proteic killer suppression protein
MIKSWKHKGLEEFFTSGRKAGIRPDHASKLKRQLAQLNVAQSPQDMNLPGWRLHGLEGRLADHFAVTVNGNWRMTFRFEGTDAVLVDYQDYH